MAQWFWTRRFLKFVNVFLLFCNYRSLEKIWALHLNKLESPSPKDALSQVWLKLALWFLRRRFLKVCQCFFAISLSKDALYQVWLKLAHGSWEEDENVKSLHQGQRRHQRQIMDKFWSEKLTWAFGSGELIIMSFMRKMYKMDKSHVLNDVCVKFVWKWLSAFREKDYYMPLMYFHYVAKFSNWKSL